MRVALCVLLVFAVVLHAHGESVTSQGTQASQSVATGSGLASHIAGYFQTFTISARTAAGAAVASGTDKFRVHLQSNTDATTITGSVVDFANGTYAVRYASYNPGSFALNVRLAGPAPSPNSILFGNGNNYIELGNAPILKPTQYTVQTYFKTSSTANEVLFRWHDNGYGIRIENGVPQCLLWLSSGFQQLSATGTSYADNKWHHIACTFDGTLLVIYMDGAKVNRQTAVGSISYSNPSGAQIGASSNTLHYHGSLDDVRVYNHSRSQSQIQDSILQAATPTDFGLLANWNFDSRDPAASSVVIDLAGNVNGTLTGDFLYQTDTPDQDFATPLHISGSPFALTVSAQPTTVYGPDLLRTTPGLNRRFTIQATDSFGANKTLGGDLFTVTLVPIRHAATNITATVTDLANGTYAVSYDATNRAVFETSVRRVGPSENRFALAFDGTSSYVWLGYAQAMQVGAVSIQAWFRSSSTSSKATILAWYKNGYRVHLNQGKVTFVLYDELSAPQTLATTATYNDNAWHQLVCTFSGSQQHIYIDGSLAASRTATFNVIYFPNAGATIGRLEDTLDHAYFAGYIDELAIWSYARTASQVAQTYNTQLKGDEQGLIAYWNMDEGSGSILQDIGPNSIRGTINAATFDSNTTTLLIFNPPGVAGSPFTTMLNFPTNGSLSTISPGAGVAGLYSFASIQAIDIGAVARDYGGDSFSATLVGPAGSVPIAIFDNDNGTYALRYNATVAGSYSLSATLQSDGNTLANSPASVTVHPNVASPRSLLYAVGQLASQAGATNAVLRVQGIDAFGNNRTTGGDSFAVLFARNGASVTVAHSLQHQANGMWLLSFNATLAGSYAVDVRVAGQSIASSPFAGIQVTPAATHAPTSTVFAPGLYNTVAGQLFNVSFGARDAFGNARTVGGDPWSVTLVGALSTSPALQVLDLGNGNYTGIFRPLAVDTYTFRATLNGVTLASGGVVRTQLAAAPFDVTQGLLTGLGDAVTFVAGVQGSFALQGRDAFGNPVTGASAAYTIYIPDSTFANQTGTFAFGSLGVNVALNRASNYSVQATLNGVPAANSPQLLRVVPASVHAPSCFAYGPGVTISQTGGSDTFTIQSADQFGNNRTLGGDLFAINVIDAQNASVSVATGSLTDLANGRYSASYNVTQSGTYNVSVTLAGVHIAGSPFVVSVVAFVPDPTLSSISGFNTSLLAGQGDAFSMDVFDAFGNRDDQAEPFTVRYTRVLPFGQPFSGTGSAVFQGNGRYAVSLNVTQSGTFTVSVRFQDSLHVSGSPYTLQVLPLGIVSGSASIAVNVPASVVAANDVHFDVLQRDVYGNNVTVAAAQGNLVVSVQRLGDGGVVNATHTAQGTGYNVVWSSTVSGTYNVALTLFGQSLVNSPLQTVLLPQPTTQYNKSVVAMASPVRAGVQLLRVRSADQYGNFRSVGGDSYTLGVTSAALGPSGLVFATGSNLTDLGTGAYETSTNLTLVGTYTLTARGGLAQTELGNSPFALTVLPNVITAARSSVNASTLPTTVAASDRLTVQLQARDEFGNDLTSGGDDALVSVQTVHVATSTVQTNTSYPASIDLASGKYTLQFPARIAGATQLWVRIGSLHVAGSPYAFNVVAATPSAAQCAILSPASPAVAGQSVHVVVLARDTFGNNATAAANTFALYASAVNATGATQLVSSIALTVSADAATYAFNATLAGTYTLSARVQATGTSVPGTQQVVIVPADAVAATSTVAGAGGLTSWNAGATATVYVQLRDQYGNRVSQPGVVTFATTNMVSSDVTYDSAVGPAAIRFVIQQSGSYQLAVRVAGALVAPNYDFSVLPLTQVRSVAFSGTPGPFNAGAPGSASFVARDLYGNTMSGNTGASALVAEFVSLPANASLAFGGSDGVYIVNFTATTAGTHTLRVRSTELSQVLPTPVNVQINPLGGVANLTTAAGAGLANVGVAQASTFSVTVRDIYGNTPTASPTTDQVTVTFHPAASVASSSVSAAGNSVYTVAYNATVTGELAISVFVAGERINNDAPFTVQVLGVAETFAGASHIVSNSSLVAGEDAQFVVQSRDVFGNRVNVTTDAYQLSVPALSLLANSTYVLGSNGQHRLAFTTTKAGTFAASIRLAGVADVQGSPFSLQILPAQANAAACNVVSAPASVQANQSVNVHVLLQSRDEYLNLRTHTVADVFGVSLSLAGAVVQQSTATPAIADQGRYSWSTALTRTGTYSLALALDNTTPIAGSPLTIVVTPGPRNVARTSVSGAALTQDLQAGLANDLALQFVDVYNNSDTTATGLTASINVTLSGSAAQGATVLVTETGAGAYRVRITPLITGDLRIRINIDNTDVHGFAAPGYAVTVAAGNRVPVQTLRFSDDGVRLLAVFSTATDMTGLATNVYTSCDAVFTATSVQTLGLDARCVFESPQLLVVRLGSAFAVRTGAQLAFKAAGLGLANDNRTLELTTTTVLGPQNSPTPVVSVVLPATLGKCDGLRAIATVAAGTAPVQGFHWTVSSTDATPSEQMAAASAAAVANAQASAAGVLVLSAADLAANRTWTVAVHVTNIFGQNSSLASAQVAKSALDTPGILVAGGLNQTVRMSSDLTLAASASVFQCSGASVSAVTYAWQSLSGLTLDQRTAATQTLHVPASTWTHPGAQFHFRLRVTAAGVSSSVDVHVSVEADPLVAVIAGGSARRLSAALPFGLNATGSNPVALSGFSYAWSCVNISTLPGTACVSNGSQLVLPSVPALTSILLDSPGLFRFTVQVSAYAQTSTASVELTMTEAAATGAAATPIVLVDTASLVVNTADRLVLHASYDPQAPAVVSWLWSVDLASTHLDLRSSDVVSTANTAATLVIFGDRLVPGQTYVFTVNGTTATGTWATASMRIAANQAPNGGALSLAPANGTALNTQFTLAAPGWVDAEQHYPLQFQFFRTAVHADGTSTAVPLGPPSTQTVLTTQLPLGDASANGALQLHVRVYDARGAYSTASVTAYVTGNAQAGDLTTDIASLQQLATLGDCEAAKRLAGALIERMNEQVALGIGSADSRRTWRQQVLTIALQCFNATHIDKFTVHAQLLSFRELVRVSGEVVNNDTRPLLAHVSDVLSRVGSLLPESASTATTLVTQVMTLSNWTQNPQAYASVFTDARAAIHRLGFLLLDGVQCGEQPVSAGQGGLLLKSTRQPPSTWVSSVVDVGTTSFGLPNSVFSQITGSLPCVDGLLVSWDTNPYAYDAQSASIASNVSSFSMLDASGSPLVVSDLLEPLNMTYRLPVVVSDTQTATCEFWKPLASGSSSGEWSRSGCSLKSVTGSVVVCECNHLTDFGLRLTESPPNIDVKVVFEGPLQMPVPVMCVVVFASVPVVTAFLWFLIHLAVLFIVRKRDDTTKSERGKQGYEADNQDNMLLGKDSTVINHRYMRRRPKQPSFAVEFKETMWYHHALLSMLQRLNSRVSDTYTEFQREHVATVVLFSIMAAESYLLDSQEVQWFSTSGAVQAASVGLFFSLFFSLFFQKIGTVPSKAALAKMNLFEKLDGVWLSQAWMRPLYVLCYLYLATCAFITFWYSRCFTESMGWSAWFGTCFAAYGFFILVQEMIKVLLITLWRRRARKERRERTEELQLRDQARVDAARSQQQGEDNDNGDEGQGVDFAPPGSSSKPQRDNNGFSRLDEDDEEHDGLFGIQVDENDEEAGTHGRSGMPRLNADRYTEQDEGEWLDEDLVVLQGLQDSEMGQMIPNSARSVDLAFTMSDELPDVQTYSEPKKRKKQASQQAVVVEGMEAAVAGKEEAQASRADEDNDAPVGMDSLMEQFASPEAAQARAQARLQHEAQTEEDDNSNADDDLSLLPLSSLTRPQLDEDNRALFTAHKQISPRKNKNMGLPQQMSSPKDDEDDESSLPRRTLPPTPPPQDTDAERESSLAAMDFLAGLDAHEQEDDGEEDWAT